MLFVVKEIKTNRFLTQDPSDPDELSHDFRQAEEFSFAEAEILCETLNRLHGGRYKFEACPLATAKLYA